MMTKRKKTGFERFAKKLLSCTFVVFVIGVIGMNSYESTLNINCQDIENEIVSIESDIDGLNMKKQELASFSRVSSIATKKGYSYQQGTATAAVVSAERE